MAKAEKKLLNAARDFRGCIEGNPDFNQVMGIATGSGKEDFNGSRRILGESSGEQACGEEAGNSMG
jgi:hypothetical protein